MNKLQYYSEIFLASVGGFLLGVAMRSFVLEDGAVFMYGTFIFLVAFIVGFRKCSRILLVSFFVVFLVLGVWRTQNVLDAAQDHLYENTRIEALGYIAQEPISTEFSQRLIVRLVSCKEYVGICRDQKVLVYGDRWKEYVYGEEVKISCTLVRPENFSQDFDWRMYLAKDGVYYECQDVEQESTGNILGNALYRNMLSMRQSLESVIEEVIPQPEAALGNGLLFGGSTRLSKEMQNDFSQTSMTHIVAVSGYNVSILSYYFLVLGIALGLKRQKAFWFAVIGIFVFVAMIGFPSSAIRAGIMGVLLLWAMKHGRLSDSLRALLLAGALMLAWNPLLIRWDIGFQLSFMASLGIVLLAPFWEESRLLKGKTLGLADILFVTFAAQIFVIPIVLYNFHVFSPISFLANLLILGFIPVTMLFVFFASVCGLVWIGLAQVFGWIAYLFLKYDIFVIQYLSSHNPWQYSTNEFSVENSVIWYLIMFAVVGYLHYRRRKRIQKQCKTYANI